VRDYRLLIFDWDGTLVDSIGRIVAAIRQAASLCQLPQLSEAEIRGIIGLGLPQAIASLYPRLQDAGQVECFRQAYSKHYLKLEDQPAPLFAGVEEGLRAFRDKGYRLAVATGKSRAGLNKVLQGRGWLDYFDITRCSDETASKPDPRMLEEILGHFSLEPAQALMVGDSRFDLQMAQRAGMHSVAVGYGAMPLEVLRAEGPTLAIERFPQLSSWLAGADQQTVMEVDGYVR
jgi:phosphoglycolate phosphatase